MKTIKTIIEESAKTPSYSKHTDSITITNLPVEQMRALIYVSKMLSKNHEITDADIDDKYDILHSIEDFYQWVSTPLAKNKYPELYK